MSEKATISLRIGRRYPGVEQDEARILAMITKHWEVHNIKQMELMSPFERLIKVLTKRGIIISHRDPPKRSKKRALSKIQIVNNVPIAVITLPTKGTEEELLEMLVEEMYHLELTHGNILDQSKVENRKQENRARDTAYEHLLPLSLVTEAIQAGCTNTDEIAEYCDRSPLFVKVAVERYIQKDLLQF